MFVKPAFFIPVKGFKAARATDMPERRAFRMWTSENWKEYALLDCGGGERLERWGSYTLVRPDPQAIWEKTSPGGLWAKPDAKYFRSKEGGGHWEKYSIPESWQIRYGELVFNIKPMNFKHTGIFPEQAANWDWAQGLISSSRRKIRLLNLFGYTGAATLSAARAGAEVCHVDAARGMVAWGRENAASSNLADRPIRWIIDDCMKFIEREKRRGSRYDAIIMDPPSYGRGPSGEVWHIEEALERLIKSAAALFTDEPLFMLVNSYSTGLSPWTVGYLIQNTLEKKYGGKTDCAELGLRVESSGLALPCGASTRWQAG